MNNEMMKERIQQALNSELSGLRTSSEERDRLYENAIGGTKVKRKLTAGLVLALALVGGVHPLLRRFYEKAPVWLPCTLGIACGLLLAGGSVYVFFLK